MEQIFQTMKERYSRMYFRKIKHQGIGCFVKSAQFEKKQNKKQLSFRGISTSAAFLLKRRALFLRII